MKDQIVTIIQNLDQQIAAFRENRMKEVNTHNETMTQLQYDCAISNLLNARASLEIAACALDQFDNVLYWIADANKETSVGSV